MNYNWKKGFMVASVTTALLFSNPFQSVNAAEFVDIENHWAYDDVSFLQQEGLLFPINTEKFQPKKEITRAQFVTMIVQAINVKKDGKEEIIMESAIPFSDVKENKWYSDEITAAKEAGITTGDQDGLFRPDDFINRAEIATMILRAFDSLQPIRPTVTFHDVSNHHWAYDSIAFASKAGIIVGYDDYTFKPHQNVSRAEAAVMISRVLQGGESRLPPMFKYRVVKGDTLSEIAKAYKVEMISVKEVNGLETDQLEVGQILLVPAPEPEVEKEQKVELLKWSDADNVFSIGKNAVITDVYTGKTFNVRRTYGANHADSEPLTTKDTATMKGIWGEFTWDTRPIIVEVDGRSLAAAMHNMPHSVQKIKTNNYPGHTCIHFLGSTKHHDGSIWDAMQRDINIAAKSK
jgi:LysM repeat protein